MSMKKTSGAGPAFARLVGDRLGSVATIFAIALPVIIGAIGLGTEAAYWMQTQRAMQDAADAAAIAAATNAGTSHAIEAKAVTAFYGFTDGVNHISVTATNTAACPTGGSTCFGATPTFVLATAPCEVTANVTYEIKAGPYGLSVPVDASACYP
jgi:Flp pilus assembly protein TadG